MKMFTAIKRASTLALVIAAATLLFTAPAFAKANTSPNIFVATGWPKGNFKFDIVVGNKPGTKMYLYVDDLNNYKATVNKQGWATFKGVDLSGSINQDHTTGKLSFTRVVNGGKQKPINYTRRYTASSNNISFSDLYIHPTADIYNITNDCDSEGMPFISFFVQNHASYSMAYDIKIATFNASDKQVGSVEGVYMATAGQELPPQALHGSGSCGATARLLWVNAYDADYVNGQPSFN